MTDVTVLAASVEGVATRDERAMSFGGVAGDYDRLRPGPPDAAADWLLPDDCRVAVDLAAGTGLLTRVLARKVPRVIAVEPDERMAAVLRARSPGAEVIQGRGESIPLPDASADGVFISSAWHWLDPGRAVPEIGRVLRDGGRLGVIWTSRDREVGWVRDLGWPAAATAGDDRRGETPRRRRGELTLPENAPFSQPESASFRFTRVMTVDAVVGMLATYSGVITASAEDRATLLARARTMLEQRFPGASEIDVPMRTWCWRADRLERP
jgi:SAM-dependent methyltransferase